MTKQVSDRDMMHTSDCKCPQCGAVLTRSPSGYFGCSRVLDHTRLLQRNAATMRRLQRAARCAALPVAQDVPRDEAGAYYYNRGRPVFWRINGDVCQRVTDITQRKGRQLVYARRRVHGGWIQDQFFIVQGKEEDGGRKN